MSRILTTCPVSGVLVPTGHRTSEVDVATMIAPRAFRCTACNEVHLWGAQDAIVEKSPDYRSAA